MVSIPWPLRELSLLAPSVADDPQSAPRSGPSYTRGVTAPGSTIELSFRDTPRCLFRRALLAQLCRSLSVPVAPRRGTPSSIYASSCRCHCRLFQSKGQLPSTPRRPQRLRQKYL
ncbi:hypothetical protein NDU88_002620 [Pleurodeles waltl]|uniref:Uncharacterized protein n=1 Tax=Pleurodeles waltl TaxID=8319 RepID=A0AAV7QAF6_PLEWA|nr:hypothetical protein NDU88_002620 [Pleurodeles waltl]